MSAIISAWSRQVASVATQLVCGHPHEVHTHTVYTIEVPPYLVAIALACTFVPLVCSVIAMALLVECARLRAAKQRIERENELLSSNEQLTSEELSRLKATYDASSKKCSELAARCSELEDNCRAIVELNMRDNAAFVPDEYGHIKFNTCM
jgi:glutamate racemase